MQIKAIKTRIFKENEDLIAFIFKYIKKVPENSVLVVTSKIISLAEGRVLPFVNKKEKEKIIKAESEYAVKTKFTWLTIKDSMFIANAGVDESNARGKMILLPKDSFKSAQFLRKKIIKNFKLKNFGIIITDSYLVPLRNGTVGVALGYTGFNGIRNYIGTKDIFGRTLKMSKTNVADSLATAAVLCMGEGKEIQPLAIIKNPPVTFTKKTNNRELIINRKEDIYAPFYKNTLFN